jgi:small subunit ribosomal protein S16
LGNYNPRTQPSTLEVQEERVYHWLRNGAQPSESVEKLFKSIGLMDRFARVKAGETLETVLADAAKARPVVNPKTSRVTTR